VATATAAYSCDQTMATLHPRLGAGGGGAAIAAFERRWILNYMSLRVYSYLVYSAFSYQKNGQISLIL
jgi:hypothetical protein